MSRTPRPTATPAPSLGYGSEAFEQARRLTLARRGGDGRPNQARGRLPREVRHYERNLPAVTIRLTAEPPGRMIRQHLAIRDNGIYKYRNAQGLLILPDTFADYLRGRSRQAVRTNVRRAREVGLTVDSGVIDNWQPGPLDSRGAHLSPAPIERWVVHDAAGRLLADSIMTVDDEVALLHGLIHIQTWEHATAARWLLHTAIVERLCGRCATLLVVSDDDAYSLPDGQHHFQRLLGYQVSRLRLSPLNDVRRARARGRLYASRAAQLARLRPGPGRPGTVSSVNPIAVATDARGDAGD